MSLHHFLQLRQLGLSVNDDHLKRTALYKNYSPLTMKEIPINVSDCNKIFASKWISPNEIAFGTKCNQLKVLNVSTSSQYSIPLLRRNHHRSGTASSLSPHNNRAAASLSNCGIHSIDVNPSMTRLATGGENPEDVAVYSLPQIDPLRLGEKGHGDWMFCSAWLDDEFLATGSRDNYLCLWHIPSDLDEDRRCSTSDSFEVPSHELMEPLTKQKCQTSERVRAMAFNPQRAELAVTSLNGYIHTWDAVRMKQVRSEKLIECQETATLCYSAENNLYCCGSYHFLMLFDPRTMRLAQYCELKDRETGIRSLATVDNVLTTGSGKGLIRFFDMRANKFITCNCGVDWTLKVGSGRISDESVHIPDMFNIPLAEYRQAIYTISYDRSNCRLFAAGGPLHAQISGNYAGLWI